MHIRLKVLRILGPVVVPVLAAAAFLLLPLQALADVSRFTGEYTGSVDIVKADGDIDPRDMSVKIQETRKGFIVMWTATTEKDDGRKKTKSYEVEFVPSGREGVFAAAMTRNVFGHAVPLNPMEGEPFVWGRVTNGTMTVFSLFIHPNGDYEMQQYDRSLADGGLDLVYISRLNGEPKRRLETFLTRQ
ncbi:MAG: hypothetical protein AB3N24_15825 [Leisingera sp.]